MRTVFVVGHDWKFRALLRAQLREEGYEALGFETLAEAAGQLKNAKEGVLVFDTSEASRAEFESALTALAARLPVLVVAGAQETFSSTALRVRRRPVRLEEVVAAVETLAAGPA